MGQIEDLEQEYLEASGGDARDALRSALGDALAELATVRRQVETEGGDIEVGGR